MIGKISRRRFFSTTLVSFIAWPFCNVLRDPTTDLGRSPETFETLSAEAEAEEAANAIECFECNGHGSVVCQACDGTRAWTDFSEGAGLYERESARNDGRCAWCNEWGEAKCPICEGVGFITQDYDVGV